MDTKIINWRDEFIKLFPENTERKLKDNHKWCEKCNGLGFVRENNYIEFCNTCRGLGQIELCTKMCGREKKYPSSVCEECGKEKKIEREEELYKNAQKIKFIDYDGMFFEGENVVDGEEFADNLYYKIKDGEDYLTYAYGTIKTQVIHIKLKDIICEVCEDGYDDMSDYINYDGVDEIQELIDEWIKKQGDLNCTYEKDYKVVVLLDDLIKEISEEI